MTARISEFIEKTNQAKSQEEVFELYLEALKSYGYDSVVYSYMTDSPTLKKRAQHGVVRNYSEDWMKYYAEKNYIHHDPVYRTALASRSPFIWTDLEKRVNLSKKQVKVMNESRDARLLDGMALSIRGPMGEIIGMGIASSSGKIHPDRNMLSKIYALSNQFHLAFSHFEEEEVFELVTLTDKECEVLLWSALGKSNSVIGEILMISDHAVDFHLRNIFRKLNANCKTVATLKAYKMGLIRL